MSAARAQLAAVPQMPEVCRQVLDVIEQADDEMQRYEIRVRSKIPDERITGALIWLDARGYVLSRCDKHHQVLWRAAA